MTRAVMILLSLGALTTPAPAMQAAPESRAPGRWLPHEGSLTGGLTAAQRTEAMALLERFERMVKQIPELAHPDGFEIQPIISGGARQHGTDFRDLPGSVVEYSLGLRHYRPTRALAGEGSTCLSITVNSRQSGTIRDAEGRPIYIESNRATPSTDPNISDSRVARKATQVYGALWNVARERSGVNVLFVSAGDLPWKPVSREEFYKANVLELEGPNGEKQAAFRNALEKTPYEEFMEGAAQRKKDREAAAAQLKGIVPDAQIEKFRQTQEETERELGEKLKKDEARHRTQNNEALTRSFEYRDNVSAELARMTPEERRMPAYINNVATGPSATGWTITSDDTPPAWRVLTPNFDFYRARRSPVEARSITVSMSMSFTCNAQKIRQAIWKAYHTLDWEAINQLLETPR